MKYIFENISVCYYFLDIFQQILKERERERERESQRENQNAIKGENEFLEDRMANV